MNEIRRKLRSQGGVTVLFALVIFLMMALFSYVMVNASLTAVQGAYAGQFDQQAYLSTRSVAFMIHNTLKQYEFTVTEAGWENTTADTLSPCYLRIGNVQSQFGRTSVWKITNVDDEAAEKFGFVRVTMEPDFPSIIVRLEHCDYDKSKPDGYDSNTPSDYKMTVTITGEVSPTDSTVVTFLDATMTAQQGVS